MRLVVATRNAHKVLELERLLDGAAELVAPAPDVELPPETGETFEANALIKARAVTAATGVAALADDSGIEADALGGAPGVRSARYAGEAATDAENLAKLRAQVPPGSGLRYVCVMAYAAPRGEERTFRGECRGTMGAEARGDGGFGYDPVFVPEEAADGRTMAELSPGEKDAISHRGRAVDAFRSWLAG